MRTLLESIYYKIVVFFNPELLDDPNNNIKYFIYNKNRVDWDYISYYELSGEFLREFKNELDWYYISRNNPLSEDIIREFQDYVDWYYISKYQILSREFCEEFKDKLHKDVLYIQQFDNLPYRPDYTNSWSYEQKLEMVENSKYKNIIQSDNNGDYIVVYKGIKRDRKSKYNPNFIYLVGETYETRSDDYLYEYNSYGFGAWDYVNACHYCFDLIIKVKIYIKDITAIIPSENDKIRCKRMTILT